MLTNCLPACAHLTITVSEIERDICEKNRHFIIPLAFDAPIRGFPSEYCHPVWYGKTRMVGLPDSEKNFEDMYNGLGTIPACDRQTDGQTDRHGIVRAMHTRRAVNIGCKCFRVFFIMSQIYGLSGACKQIQRKVLCLRTHSCQSVHAR